MKFYYDDEWRLVRSEDQSVWLQLRPAHWTIRNGYEFRLQFPGATVDFCDYDNRTYESRSAMTDNDVMVWNIVRIGDIWNEQYVGAQGLFGTQEQQTMALNLLVSAVSSLKSPEFYRADPRNPAHKVRFSAPFLSEVIGGRYLDK